METVWTAKYGELYRFWTSSDIVDAIRDGAREYANEPDMPGEYWNGYEDGIRSALAAIGLQGEKFEQTIASMFMDIE